MALSFSSQGSTAGTPTKGLLGNSKPGVLTGYLSNQPPNMSMAPKTGLIPPASMSIAPSSGTNPGLLHSGPTLNTHPFGNPDSGIIGTINNITGLSQKSTPGLMDQPGKNPGMLPSTPVKKITTNNTDGSSTTHEFHVPDATSSTDSSSSSDKTSSSNSNKSGNNPGVLPSSPKVGTQTQNAQNVLDTSNLNNNPEYQILAKQNNELVREQEGAKTAGIGGTPIPNTGTNNANYQNLFTPQTTASLQGRENEFNTNNSIQMTGNAAESNRLLSGAQLATGGAENVLSAGAPQFGVQPGTLVGQPLQSNGGIDQNYLGGIAAPANIKSVQDFTSQINTTQKSVDTLHNLASQIVPNMGTTGFNPTSSPIGNQSFAQYFTEKNPAAKAGIVAGLGELKNQISNVIASATGLTPTGVTAVTDTYDLSTLNPQQLNDFLQYIDQYAQSNMDAAQKGIDRIKSGGDVSANPSPLPAPKANSTGQALAGTGATLASGLITKIISQAGDTAAGAAGGLAASILK